MQEEVLSRDTLFHDRKENMSPWQRERYELMQGINHFINCALHGHRELSTGKCLTMPYSEFLSDLADEFEKTMHVRKDCVHNISGDERSEIAVFDDFFRIADFAYIAIKNIIQNPSRQIKKVEVKLPAARASSFTGKTMQWMSKRPGRTIAEKISPENKILTTKTVFSVDTKENRELMYLFKHLYEIISTRLSATQCMNCNKLNACNRNWIVNMQRMISSYSHLKGDELGEVKAEKQAIQNNKLMCDLNYKIIWDAVKMLSRVEEDIIAQFKKVAERLARLLYWLLVGSVLKDRRAKIYDSIGKVVDDHGEVSFIKSADNIEAACDKVIFVDANAAYKFTLEFFCEGTVIKVVRSDFPKNEGCIALIDIAEYFHEMEEFFMGIETGIKPEENLGDGNPSIQEKLNPGEVFPKQEEPSPEVILTEQEEAVVDDNYTQAVVEPEETVPEQEVISYADIMNMRIEDMGISVRTYNCLVRAKKRHMSYLVAMTEKEAYKIRNLGRTGVEEIKTILSHYGLHFRKDS